MRITLFLLLFSTFLSCVSSGKYKTLQSEKIAAEQSWSDTKSGLESNNQKLAERNEKVNEQLTHQNTLLSELLNDKIELEKEVTALKERIASLSSESKSMEAVLNDELAQKNENLKLKEAKLNRMINWLLQQEANLNRISTALGEAMTGYNEEEIDWFFQDNRLDIILYQDFMFTSSISLSPKGVAALDKLSAIIAEFASLDIYVEGHTDNTYSDASRALNASTDRAVVIGTHLLDNGDVNGNQMTVCGRGSYFPRVSNQTPAGRALNNRVEISLRPPYQQLLDFLDE